MSLMPPSDAPLGTNLKTASAQLRDALVLRGIQFVDHPGPDGLHFQPVGRLYQSFMVSGGPGDLDLVVHPTGRPGLENRPDRCWEFGVSLEVVVRWDADRPARAERLHAVPARALESLGFIQDEVDFAHIPGDSESYWISDWTKFVFSVDEAADMVVALMEVDCCQYPDGDEWMQTLVPLSTDQVERLLAQGVGVDEAGQPRPCCPVVMATGDYYWIPPVTPVGSLRLVGPGGEMAASVSQTHHWYTCALSGEILAQGQGVNLVDAMNTAERLARGFGATREEVEACR